ncbi:hypothetical protein [Methylobacterium brachythecii]|uniref:Uncharacterized protein n=1 Tax=Methylobacterium brachythecii TaxID=1176177 RepID=A0A7W6F9A5_9HYPH|nr:hypothetical protein [Methylobacterium brachythecii]MBB3905317.1 hypothetical protein [Methylobacterium brachythecii]
MSETTSPPDDSDLSTAAAFMANWAARRQAQSADNAAPAHVAGIRETRLLRSIAPHPVATAAALPSRLRRLLVLAADGVAGRGVPVWGLMGVTGRPEADVVADVDTLCRRGLVTLTLPPDDLDIEARPTVFGHRVAAAIVSTRIF